MQVLRLRCAPLRMTISIGLYSFMEIALAVALETASASEPSRAGFGSAQILVVRPVDRSRGVRW
jgi:hypothetical protein